MRDALSQVSTCFAAPFPQRNKIFLEFINGFLRVFSQWLAYTRAYPGDHRGMQVHLGKLWSHVDVVFALTQEMMDHAHITKSEGDN